MSEKSWPLRDYILGDLYDGELLQIVHKLDRANFAGIVAQVLDDYGLGQQLQQAVQQAASSGAKIQIVDIGCGEGLFLHHLARILEERGLLSAAEINGIDIDPAAIATAEAYSGAFQPPRPYLRFYLHDATQPFELNPSLRAEGKTGFDFILVRRTAEYLPRAEDQIKRFYAMLKPGGVFHQRSVVARKGSDGWLPAHPALEPVLEGMSRAMISTNGGQIAALQAATWLAESGASQVQVSLDCQPVGGPTEQGLLGLRNMVMTVRNLAPSLIKRGLLTQAQSDEIMAILFRELGPHLQGQWTFADTLARKPLTLT